MKNIILFCAPLLLNNVILANSEEGCPLREDTSVVYYVGIGVGRASQIWVQDFLWWWSNGDSSGAMSFKYQSLDEKDVQNCDLETFSNLKLYINPGGNAYNQLSGLGHAGYEHVKAYLTRNQEKLGRSSYAGFCAGAYMAARDYIWESKYEGPDYFAFEEDPPFNIFEHTVEGSLYDITDEQFGDQFGTPYRMVNVSNGQQMLYYGGSSFGYNGVPAYHDPSSTEYDPEIEVLLYYQDFYGYFSYNLPAAWKVKNAFLTSVHAEADNCTAFDCPKQGTIPTDRIFQNRAWLAAHLNNISQSAFKIPTVPLQPCFNTTAPHKFYPRRPCTLMQATVEVGELKDNGTTVIFCDGFDAEAGTVSEGLWQWQRNQSNNFNSQPWNSTFISEWAPSKDSTHGPGKPIVYGSPYSGNGWAVAVPMSTTHDLVSMISRPVLLPANAHSLKVSYAFKGYTGHFATSGFSSALAFNNSSNWQILQQGHLLQEQWKAASFTVPIQLDDKRQMVSSPTSSVRLSFVCVGSEAEGSNFCGIDSVQIAFE